MAMEMLFHIATGSDWRAAQEYGAYEMSTRGQTLAEVGFIHLSFGHQVAGVANAFYVGERDLVVLVIDPARVTAPIREEAVPAHGGERFPHVYGPLNLDAVVEVRPFEPDAGGQFSFP